MVGLAHDPEIERFLAKSAAILDAEMEESGWEPYHFPRKAVQYYAGSKDGSSDAYSLILFGAEDPADCSRIRVGAQISAASTQLRDEWCYRATWVMALSPGSTMDISGMRLGLSRNAMAIA
jgi:hypothetical protein